MSQFYFKYVCGLLALLTFLELCTADGKKKGSGTFGPYYQWAASYLPKKQYGYGHGHDGYGHGHGGSGKSPVSEASLCVDFIQFECKIVG